MNKFKFFVGTFLLLVCLSTPVLVEAKSIKFSKKMLQTAITNLESCKSVSYNIVYQEKPTSKNKSWYNGLTSVLVDYLQGYVEVTQSITYLDKENYWTNYMYYIRRSLGTDEYTFYNFTDGILGVEQNALSQSEVFSFEKYTSPLELNEINPSQFIPIGTKGIYNEKLGVISFKYKANEPDRDVKNAKYATLLDANTFLPISSTRISGNDKTIYNQFVFNLESGGE